MTKKAKPVWKDFDHRFKAHLKASGMAELMRGKKLCVALSGGADSVALLQALARQQNSLGIELSAAHFHHGRGKNLRFRVQALKFCLNLCESLSVPLRWQRHDGAELKSEAQMREARWQFFGELLQHSACDFVLTAHHAEDQLETRLLHLLRGCGPEGLRGMSAFSEQILRPFLSTSKEEILKFVKDLRLKFIEDPSNSNVRFRRNWLRHEWLPQLEKIQPGSVKVLSNSLHTISEAFQHQSLEQSTLVWYQGDHSKGLDRRHFSALSRAQQKQALVQYLKHMGTHDFRHTQLEEIVKNLDRSQIVHTFIMLRLRWHVNAEQILARS